MLRCAIVGRRDRCDLELKAAGATSVHGRDYKFPFGSVRYAFDARDLRGLNIDYVIVLDPRNFIGVRAEAEACRAEVLYEIPRSLTHGPSTAASKQ